MSNKSYSTRENLTMTEQRKYENWDPNEKHDPRNLFMNVIVPRLPEKYIEIKDPWTGEGTGKYGWYKYIPRDEQGRYHCETGPVFPYDDTPLYYWHGVALPGPINGEDGDKSLPITAPHKITVDIINKETNLEIRRIFLEKYGIERYVKEQNAEVLDKDVDPSGRERTLLRVRNGQDEPIIMCQVLNSSPEIGLPQEYATFMLRTDFECRPIFPGLTGLALEEAEKRAKGMSRQEKISNGYLGDAQALTCHNAVASTFGKYGHEYGLPGQTRQGDVFIEMKSGKSKNTPFRES